MKILHSKKIDEQNFTELVNTIKDFVVKFIHDIANHYGNLSKSISPNFCKLSRNVIEEKLWPSIYDGVFDVFKRKTEQEDQLYLKQMDEFRTMILPHFGVKQLFWLVPDENDPVPPYHSAISLLSNISRVKSPALKIKQLSKVAKEIVSCIKKCWEGKVNSDQLDVGADDLIPLMSYVILKSNVPDLASHCTFMEAFIDDHAVIEEGIFFF